jgi:hypothetical protein
MLVDIEKFDQSFSPPSDLFGLFINYERISSSDIISIEGLMRVDLILLWSTCSYTKVNNIKVFELGMACFHSLKGLAIFAYCFIHFSWISQDFFLLSYSPELFLSFGSFYKISRIVLLDFLI